MKSKSIDSEVEELNSRFQQLETKYNRLRNEYSTDNLLLREKIVQLEAKNIEQEKKLENLKRSYQLNDSTSTDINAPISRSSFSEGDIVKVINQYKGQYGSIGKVYRVTNRLVHFTDIKTGISISRALKNVQKLTLSDKEKSNLLSK